MKAYVKTKEKNVQIRRTKLIHVILAFMLVCAVVQISISNTKNSQVRKKDAVEAFSGAVQLCSSGYCNAKQVDKAFDINETFLDTLRAHPQIAQVASNIEAAVQVSYRTKSKTVLTIGSDLAAKSENLRSKLIEGSYPSRQSDRILIGEELANHLGVLPGDSITLTGVGYRGKSFEQTFCVGGILKFSLSYLNNQVAFVNFSVAQKLLGLEGKATSVAINIDSLRNIDTVRSTLAGYTDQDFEVATWVEVNPTLYQQIEKKEKRALMLLFLLYLFSVAVAVYTFFLGSMYSTQTADSSNYSM